MAANRYIRTATGVRFRPLKPDLALIEILDVAHHLSHVNRFTGASVKPYSVGIHSVTVCRLARKRGWGSFTQLACLLHDASEAYLADVAAPVKDEPEFGFYRVVEAKLQETIYRKFLGRQPSGAQEQLIRQCDWDIFCAEWPVCMGSPEEGIPSPKEDAAGLVKTFWDFADDPVLVRALFMDDFYRLTQELCE
jgi:hypothetical protein